MSNNRILYHRISSGGVINVDYAKNRDDTDILSIMHGDGALTIEFSTDSLNTFKQDIADLNQYFMLPTTTVSDSTATALDDECAFDISLDDLDGNIIVSKESDTNAPYLIIKTLPIRGFNRIIQIYLTEDQVDKLDLISIRDTAFVFPSDSIVTIDAPTPNIIFTNSNGTFLNIEIPAGMIAALKIDFQAETDYLNALLDDQTDENATAINVISRTVVADTIDTITISHTAPGDMSYIQVVTSSELRRDIYTIYIKKDLFIATNTKIQLW